MLSNTLESVTKKGRISINELHYLVMEGGGARGTTYLGAIRGIEKLLMKQYQEKGFPYSIAPGRENNPGILDFLIEEEGEVRPIIKGIAGASAGAVTTFALALGLNSVEVEEVLRFDFTRFISEDHTGKYRMIGPDSQLMVGEDERGALGGSHSKPFFYNLNKERTEVKGNFGKRFARSSVIKLGLKVVEDGISSNLQQFYSFFFDTLGGIGEEKELNTQTRVIGRMVSRKIIKRGIDLFLYFFLKKKSPVKISHNVIASAFLDRGMFSAFQVREFFYDLMLMAATRNTHFQRQLIEQYDFQASWFEDTEDPANTLILGSRDKYNFSHEADSLLSYLQDITCKDFQALTGLNFGIAVSNFTTKSPLYFSAHYTPDFRLLEAVAASMSLPPAMRPLYNESDVYKPPRVDVSPGIRVKVNGIPTEFVKPDGSFTQSDYAIYEFAVKKALQEFQYEYGAYIDLTNLIELNTFFPLLRSLVFEENRWPRKVVLVEGNTYEIELDLLTFFYNAQYKGMLIDGGYYNNIPFNYFREYNPLEVKELPKLENVLAVKLEFGFPADFMHEINLAVGKFLAHEEKITRKMKRELARLEASEGGPLPPTGKAAKSDKVFEALVLVIKRKFKAYYAKRDFSDLENPKDLARELKVDRKAILKIMEQWLEEYGATNHVKPWAVPENILLTVAFTGYEFGSKRGQIRTLSDHNHITVCHDFGVDTYDFDLNKVRQFEKLGHENAEKVVTDFLSPD